LPPAGIFKSQRRQAVLLFSGFFNIPAGGGGA
jgi:hypothetical protein